MKIFFRFLAVVTFLIVASTNTVFAAENQPTEETETNEVSELFTNFINEAFSDLNGLTVQDSMGNDITEEFIESVSNYYSLKDFKSIQDLIVSQDLSVSITQSTYLTNKDANKLNLEENALKGIELNAGIRGENVSKMFYHLETDESGTFTKEWATTLSGSFSYDTSTYRVTNISGPRVSLTVANFGTMFSPSIENVLGDNSYSGRSATFSANYDMKAVLGISFGDLPLGFTLDFGRHTDRFTAYPSVLQ